MAMCESVRGEWGGTCPDCGQQLPERPGPLSSWKSERPAPFPSGASAGLGDRNPALVEAYRRRKATGTRRNLDRAAAIVESVARHGGNQSAAAREFGVTPATVGYYVRQARQAGAA